MVSREKLPSVRSLNIKGSSGSGEVHFTALSPDTWDSTKGEIEIDFAAFQKSNQYSNHNLSLLYSYLVLF